MRDDRVYLRHILDCIARIEEDTIGGYALFAASRTHQDAVARNLQIMAESTQRVSQALKSLQPDVPWQAIAGFRNVLVHEYLGLDFEIVWDVVVHDLPPLKSAVSAMLASLD